MTTETMSNPRAELDPRTGWTVVYRPARGRYWRRLPLNLNHVDARTTLDQLSAVLNDEAPHELAIITNLQAERAGWVLPKHIGVAITGRGKYLPVRDVKTPRQLLGALTIRRPSPAREVVEANDAADYRTAVQREMDHARDVVRTVSAVSRAYPTAWGYLAGEALHNRADVATIRAIILGADQGIRWVDDRARERYEQAKNVYISANTN